MSVKSDVDTIRENVIKNEDEKSENIVKQEKRKFSKPLYNRKFKKAAKKKRKNEYDPDEEARLERIVFGDAVDVINNLPDEEPTPKLTKDLITVSKEKEDVEDSDADDSASSAEDTEDHGKKRPAWVDEDDAQYTVDAALKIQNRKLPGGRPEKLYTELLENKYRQIVGTPKWAQTEKTEDDEYDEIESEILKHSCHIEKPKVKSLPKGSIEIKALNPLNKQTHNEGPIVTSLEFHPSSTVGLVAGTSGNLSIFQVDGIENNKLHTMHFKKFPISKATFLKEGTEILVGSQYYAHCHSYDLIGGNTHRIPLPHGITNMKKYEVSPDGKMIALCGRMGEIYLLTTSTKELISTLKMNAKCKAVAFTPDSRTLITHGENSEMYIWDINSRVCINRAIDEGCLTCSSLAITPSGQFLATGSKEGVVNIYNTDAVIKSKNPTPLKSIMNLVTSITALKFNPSSEILALASSEKSNAFKMVHIPSFNVFSNFPTYQTTLGKPLKIDFSPGSGFLGISNKSDSAFLYRLKHYGNY